MTAYIAVAFGSALGGVARFAVHESVTRQFGLPAPWATFAVNVVGSFLIGFLATLAASEARFPQSDTAQHLLMAGMLGGFTTFSTFSLQTLTLMREGAWSLAIGNVAGSIVLCLVAAWLGHAAAAALMSSR